MRSNPKWFNPKIKSLTRLKYKLHCRIRSAPRCLELRNAFASICKQVKLAVRNAICKFEASIVRACKQQPKLLFNYINGQKQCRDSIKGLLDCHGVFHTDGNKIVSILNDQFGSVFIPRLPCPAQPLQLTAIPQQDLNVDFVSPGNVRKYIMRLNPRKSPGMDSIHPFVVKSCADAFSNVLSAIFTSSYSSGKIPDAWRLAQISPIFKKGSRSAPGNYRPISLTSIPCKLMERMVRDAMMDHLYSNNVIVPEQHGFVLRKSVVTNLLEMVDRISDGIDKGFHVLVVFLDFAKAFDRVCHTSLRAKLIACKFCPGIVDWVSDFLSRRQQRVVMGQHTADWVDVSSGVPQGSVLGPLLFVIFINDMPAAVSHLVRLFADDSKLIATIRSTSDLSTLQLDLDALSEWSKTWRMLFNVSKCKAMEFSRSGKNTYAQFELLMGEDDTRSALAFVDNEKDLGVTFSRNLKFSIHIKNQVNRATGILGQLKRSFRYWTLDTCRTLYCAYVRPHLEYAAVVWSTPSKKDAKMLELVQRRATKLVPRIRNWRYEDRLAVLGLTTLHERRVRGDLIQMFKLTKGINEVSWVNPPVHASSLSQPGPASGIRGHARRLSGQASTKCLQRANTFTNRVVSEWNTLPATVIEADSVNQFKNRYDAFRTSHKTI